MKKAISLVLSAILLSSALISCGTATVDQLDPAITVTSSDAQANAAWLDERLEEIPNDVVLGIGSDATYGIDMTEFEADGYIMRELGGDVLIFGKTADGLDRGVREYAKSVEVGKTAGFDEVYHEGYRVKSFNIAGRDISEYTIYYPADKNENMLFAVEEFKRLVKKACGVDLTAVEGAPTGNAIEFRFSEDEALRYDGYKYTVTDTGIVFEGAVKRGSMNAVWRFLENECGWTNLTFGDSYLTPTDYLNVEAGIEKTETPAFDYFNVYGMFYDGYRTDRATPNAAQNSYGTITGAMHGMQNNRFDGFGGSAGIICYTSEPIYTEVYDRVLNYVESRLDAGLKIGVDFLDVDIAQGDSRDYCKCSTCMPVFREEGLTNAGAVVRFANKLSEDISELYPGLAYKIFAYDESNKPPVTVPNEMVYITFCYDIICVNHKLDGTECTDFVKNQFTPTGRNNTIYTEWFRGWCELTKNIYVWFYGLDSSLQAATYTDNIYDDFQFLYESGIKGIFWETEFTGLNFGRIEKQLGSKLLWDMEITREEFEAFYCDILEQNFGDGWYYIYEYVKLWNNAQDQGGCYHCWLFNEHVVWRYDTDRYAELFDDMYELFEQAIPLASSADQERRCELLSCHMLYEGCYSSYFPAYDAQDTERIDVLAQRYSMIEERLTENGFNMHAIYTIGGYLDFESELVNEAWKHWQAYRHRIVPDMESWRPMPEGLDIEVEMPFVGGFIPD